MGPPIGLFENSSLRRKGRHLFDFFRSLKTMPERQGSRRRFVKSNRRVLKRLLVQPGPHPDLRFSIEKSQHTAQRVRPGVVTSQGCGLNKVNSPAGFRDRFSSELIIRTSYMGMTCHPEIDCSLSVLPMKRVEKILKNIGCLLYTSPSPRDA